MSKFLDAYKGSKTERDNNDVIIERSEDLEEDSKKDSDSNKYNDKLNKNFRIKENNKVEIIDKGLKNLINDYLFRKNSTISTGKDTLPRMSMSTAQFEDCNGEEIMTERKNYLEVNNNTLQVNSDVNRKNNKL